MNYILQKLFDENFYLDNITKNEKLSIIDNMKRKIILYSNIGEIERNLYLNDLIYSDTKLTFIDLLLCDKNQFILVILKNLLPKPLLKSLDHEKLYILEEIYYDDFGDIIDCFLNNI
jgi:hypothetical protein